MRCPVSSPTAGSLACSLSSSTRFAPTSSWPRRGCRQALCTALLPWTASAAVMAYLLALGGMAWRRLGIEPMAVVASVAGVLVLTRVTMLAYIHVVAFHTAHYVSPAYPCLLLFCTASFLAAANVARRPRETRRSGPRDASSG
jgi:hypothetical protein